MSNVCSPRSSGTPGTPGTPRPARSPAQGKGNGRLHRHAKPDQAPSKSANPPHPPRKTRGPSARPPPQQPMPDWRKWRDVTVELGGLPADVTTEQLWDWFSPHGAVVWIDICDKGTGRNSTRARVRFEPPPRRPFWANKTVVVPHPKTRTYPNGLQLAVRIKPDPFPNWLLNRNSAHQRDYPVKMTIGLDRVDFGTLVGPQSMMAIKSLFPSPDLGDMKMELNLKNKWLNVYFPVVADSDGYKGTREYRFQVDLSSIKTIHQTTDDQERVVWVLPLPRPPQYFWKMDDVHATFSEDSPTWSSFDLWFRATDIAHNPNLPMKHPVAVHTKVDDPGYMEIGRWTTFRLVLSSNNDKSGADYMVAPDMLRSALVDFNIVMPEHQRFEVREAGQTMWDHLDHAPVPANGNASALLQLSASPIVHLPFEVRYQLEVCVSRGVLNEHTVTLDFLQRLAALKPFDATRRLEYLVDQNEILYNPMDLFHHSDAESYIPNTKMPYYCTLVRKAVITPTTIRYNTPTVETSNRVMRRYNNMGDRFLRVQFVEEAERGRIAMNKAQNEDIWRRVRRALYHGIRIGDRVYEFLGFGSSQLRQCGVYFFCPTEHTTCNDIREWMGHFGHIRVVARYAARIGQCFSTTREIRSICQPAVTEIADVERNGYCFTDGVGKISPLLARFIIEEMSLDIFDEPTAFQFRMGGCKGVLTVWPEAQGMEVHIRKSQEKFKAVSKGLEIIRCAKFSSATLNRQTITILECLGVPAKAFSTLLSQQIREYQQAMRDNSVAVNLLTKYVDENQSTLVLAELLNAGFRTDETQEPFTLNVLNLWRSWSLKLLKEKARIQVEKGAFVLGCVDETGTLRGHSEATEGSKDKDINKLPQIFLQLTDPRRYGETTIIKGRCIIGRNPSLHPGDIRMVEAVDNPLLHHLKDVAVFPLTGDRPVPNMLSGGDLDGDDFFVIWDPNLMPDEWNFPPMNYQAPAPLQLDRDVHVNDIRDFFVKYLKNDVLGLIASSHLGRCDVEPEGPKSQICLYLAELHSKAVDYPKTGDAAGWSSTLQPSTWPHFMGKRNCHTSKRVLGVLYNEVVRQTIEFHPDWKHAFDPRILSRYALNDELIQTARKIKRQYDVSVRRILAQHDVATEFELYTGWSMSPPAIGSDYKRQEDLGREYDALKARFREICYEAVGSTDDEKLDRFVAAMYKVTEEEMQAALYGDDAERPEAAGKCGGGSAEPKPMPLISFPWIFHWVLIRIAVGGKYKPKRSLLAAARRRGHGASDGMVRHPTVDIVDIAKAMDNSPLLADTGVARHSAFIDGDDLIELGTLDEYDLSRAVSGSESPVPVSSPGEEASLISLLDAPAEEEPAVKGLAVAGPAMMGGQGEWRRDAEVVEPAEQLETQSRQEVDLFDDLDDGGSDDYSGEAPHAKGAEGAEGAEDAEDAVDAKNVADAGDKPAEAPAAVDRLAALIGLVGDT